ncbi:hypothetical protein L9F63_008633, partial [Diploptera punctata]
MLSSRKLWRESIVLCLLVIITGECKLQRYTARFVRDYFSYKKVRIIRSFTCSLQDKVMLTKELDSSGLLWTVVSDPEGSSFPTQDAYNWKHTTYTPDYYKFGVFMDYDCQTNKLAFNQSSENSYLNGKHNWLLVSAESHTTIERSRLNVDSEVTWATPGDNQTFHLYDLYKVNYTWPLITTDAGSWDTTSGLNYNLTTYKYKRRENLQELLFDCAIAVFNPGIPVTNLHEHLISREEKNYTTLMTKCSYAQQCMLEKMFNFRTRLHTTETSNFAPFKNGSFQGQIGMMQRNEAKISPSALLIMEARDKATDYVAVTWKFETAVMFIHPKVNDLQDALLQPFTLKVWLSVVASWIIAAFTLKIATWVENKLDEESSLDSTWSATILATIGAVAEQGYEVEAKSVSWRMAFLFMLIQVVLLNNYYGGGIVSSLLAEPEKTIKTIQDIIHSQFKVGYENQSNDPQVHELYRKKIHPPQQQYPNAFRVDIGVKKMREEAFMMQTEQIGVYPYIENTFTDAEKCALTEINIFKYMFGQTHATMQKGLPYREIFTYGYRRIWEVGLKQYQATLWRPARPPCFITKEVVSVELHTISFAYCLLLSGLVVSVLVLVLERLHKTRYCYYYYYILLLLLTCI